MSLFVALVLVSSACGQYQVNPLAADRLFTGVGGLSGGGATSRLLSAYPPEQQSLLLDLLFLPNYGASLNVLKVEIGGDAQSTDGTEASHMHTADDLNYDRGYEWWLMTEAKKRNPNIKLYGLPWAFPAWVGNGTGNPFAYPDLTAGYITKWVQGADTVYGLNIDYVGLWNEKSYNITYIETLRSALDAAGYNNTMIVGTDTYSDWSIAGYILSNPAVAAAVDVIGAHYPGTHSTAQAVETGRSLWASEDMSVYNDFRGASCWARILNQNFVNGNMTTTIAWNLISSYYPGLDWYGTSILSAPEPWSGYYDTTNVGLVWVSAHTTHFAQPGWKYLVQGQGSGLLNNGGSYVTITDGNDFSIIIEKMLWEHSQCAWESVDSYSVTSETMTFVLQGAWANVSSLAVWHTAFIWDNIVQANASYFQQLAPIDVVNGQFTITVNPDEMYSITTLSTVAKASIPPSPSSQPFPNMYVDDFESYNVSTEARYFADQTGSFEIIQTSGPQGKVMRQAVPQLPILWLRDDYAPYSVIGDVQWSDTVVSASVMIETSGAAYVGARSGPCCNPGGLYFGVSVLSQRWILASSQAIESAVLVSGALNVTAGAWYNISLSVMGNIVNCWINQTKVVGGDTGYIIPSITQGWAVIGTSVQANNVFTTAQFDNFQVYGNRLACPPPSEGDPVVVTWCGEPNQANTIWQFSSQNQLQVKANPTLCLTGSSEPLPSGASLALTIEACTPSNPAQVFSYDPTQYPSTLYQPLSQNTVALNGNSLYVVSGQIGVEITTCSSAATQDFIFTGSSSVAGVIQAQNGLCLSGACSSSGGCYPGLLQPCQPTSASQLWTHNSNNELVNQDSNYCLDAEGGSGPTVGLYPCVGSTNQQWTVTSNAIVNVRNTNQCLTENIAQNSNTAQIAFGQDGSLSLLGEFIFTQCVGVCNL